MEYSLLYPKGSTAEYKTMSAVTFHDLGMDTVCDSVAKTGPEREMIRRIMSSMTADAKVTKYRCDVFQDIFNNPDLCDSLLKLLEKVNFIKDYGMRHNFDEKAGMWDLMHRLDEVNDYILCVENIYSCLSKYELRSDGLIGLKEFVNNTFHEDGYAALKADIEALNIKASQIKSVTLGVNLNQRFEAESIGLVSINNRAFSKSNILTNFIEKIGNSDELSDGNEWDENYRYHVMNPSECTSKGFSVGKMAQIKAMMGNPIMGMAMSHIAGSDISSDIPRYMDKIVDHMLHNTVNYLRDILSKHLSISIRDITGLIPELVYYVRWASFIKDMKMKGRRFFKATVVDEGERQFASGTGIYNVKLALSHFEDGEKIVTNNFSFDTERRAFILTGANRGGKTTFTQAVGQMYVLAQGGIYIPGAGFKFTPVDCIYTHFPADEDKTMDLGRLGEECSRFRDMFLMCTEKSLVLLNETFSTTSFDEGYYIARDAIRAILDKHITAIYNTHMHKLAYDIDEINAQSESDKAVSLVVESVDGECTYQVKEAPPQGQSFAEIIAKRYGVTYDSLMKGEPDEADEVPEDSDAVKN